MVGRFNSVLITQKQDTFPEQLGTVMTNVVAEVTMVTMFTNNLMIAVVILTFRHHASYM